MGAPRTLLFFASTATAAAAAAITQMRFCPRAADKKQSKGAIYGNGASLHYVIEITPFFPSQDIARKGDTGVIKRAPAIDVTLVTNE